VALSVLAVNYRRLKLKMEKGRKSMYGKLMDAEADKTRLKRQLTENVAHELKTPVSSIQGYLETIVTNHDLPSETKDHFLERCYNQSRRLSSLLQDISMLNKLDDAPEGFEKTEVSIIDLLKSIKSDTAQKAEERKVKILALVSPNVKVLGNQSLLYSIFRNLTDNAIAYAGEGASATVQVVSEDDDFYTFSFADNGVGVAPEHLPHLFERFYRVDKGRSRRLGGTGLGLAIVKNAVLLHHGKIRVQPAKTGGLEYIFTLPKA
jgi:two-component system OmpR family sensor kinase/two-component system phosphate regulon sensor histidine kinase PhoR